MEASLFHVEFRRELHNYLIIVVTSSVQHPKSEMLPQAYTIRVLSKIHRSRVWDLTSLYTVSPNGGAMMEALVILGSEEWNEF